MEERIAFSQNSLAGANEALMRIAISQNPIQERIGDALRIANAQKRLCSLGGKRIALPQKTPTLNDLPLD